MQKNLFSIHDNQALSPTVRRLRLQPHNGFFYRAGQYIEIGFPDAHGTAPRNFFPFSLASAPEDPFLELCIRTPHGHPLTHHLEQAHDGDPLWIKGPSGRFFYASPPKRPIFLIATGTGIAPLRSLYRSQERIHAEPSEVILLFGVRNPSEILYSAEWTDALGDRSIPILSQPDDSWTGEKGRISDFLKRSIHRFAWHDYDYYLCGQPELLTSTKHFLSAQNVPEDHIHHERW